LVVNGRPGVAASMPSELTPDPGVSRVADILPMLDLCDFLRALPKLHVIHCGSSMLARDG